MAALVKNSWAAAAQTSSAGKTGAAAMREAANGPEFEVRAYQLEGDTASLPDAGMVLSNYTGRLGLARLHEGMDQLQFFYRGSGFPNLTVTLPQQTLTNGVVRVAVGIPASSRAAASVADASKPAAVTNAEIQTSGVRSLATNPPAPPAPTFEVRGYFIEGNTVLPPGRFGLLSNYTGRVEFARVRAGLGQLQLLYRDLGFATIGVTLPQQKLTNGIVRVKISEGKLAGIKVEGNRHFSADNIRRALPSLDTNILINTRWFQPELDLANANPDRQIYPVVSPGLEPGTSDLTLKVKDRLPLHGHIEINDKSTPNTPLLRVDTAIQYGNLWQRENQIGFDYNFSPQAMKRDNYLPQFYDQPMVASYSGFYRLPLSFGHGLREEFDPLPVNFGYDEITHKFNLPSPTGNPDLIFYASRSVSDTPVLYGPLGTILNTNGDIVTKQSASRDLTFNNNAGTKLTIPLRVFAGIHSSFMAGFDYKSFKDKGFGTNFTYITIFGTNGTSFDTIINTNNSLHELYYLPVSLGWAAARPDKWGSFSFNYNQSFFFRPLESARTNFQTVAGSTKAGGDFTTLTAGLVRQQNLPGDWSAILNASGQWASEPLIGNEQFGLGGTGGVRGYREGEVYGDTGWRVLFDLRAPAMNVGYFPTAGGDVPADLRCSWFMDYGELYHLAAATGPAIQQWGTGVGFFLTASEHVSARLTLGWALHDTPLTRAGNAQAYFSVGCQF
jgi:hemolysin activation/secretion protein